MIILAVRCEMRGRLIHRLVALKELFDVYFFSLMNLERFLDPADMAPFFKSFFGGFGPQKKTYLSYTDRVIRLQLVTTHSKKGKWVTLKEP